MRTRVAGVAFACAVAACVSDPSRVCGDGDAAIRCPEGDACGLVDGRPVCVGSNVPHVCGDGRVDPPEQCDTALTSQCSPDCLSDLTCGNGIVDAVSFEQCDDGNPRSHDGCDSHCLVEIPRWIQIGDVDPPPRWAPAMAYDARNHELVLFGGAADGVDEIGDTWLRGNGSWSQAQTLSGPSPRARAAMAYDPADQRVYLYGGAAGGAALDDTWTWDGVTWERVDATLPNALSAPRLAYDAHRELLVLVGATPSGNGLQVWQLAGSGSGVAWTLAEGVGVGSNAVGPHPSGRGGEMIAYDPVSEQVVMFGGQLGGVAGGGGVEVGMIPTYLNDTWSFDGHWHQLATGSAGSNATTPDPTADGELAFDGTQLVLLEGARDVAVPQSTPPRAYAGGGTWTGISLPVAPAAVTQGAMATLPDEGLVVFGGFVTIDGSGDTADELSTLHGSNLVAAPSPALSCPVAAGALDLEEARPVIYGRFPGGSAARGAVELDGTRWTRIGGSGSADPGAPLATLELGGAYDEATSEVVFFGGRVAGLGGALQTGTFLWRGGQWTEVDGDAPAPRLGLALAYDASRERTVLFGGRDGVGSGFTAFDDVWTWDGAGRTWSPAAVGSADPGARYGHAMAYDRVHREIILFGGRDANGDALADTWRLTADGWAQAVLPDGAPRPSARAGAALGWSPSRRRLVLFGGESVENESDAWEWDGIGWSQLPIGGPAPRARGLLVGVRDGVVLVGGSVSYDATASPVAPDMWLLRYESARPSDSCIDTNDDDGDGLAGCADPDCWLACHPTCEPGEDCTSASGPTCGDGVCTGLETAGLCPADMCP